MTNSGSAFHSHIFLGAGHEKSERKTWAVIWLCGAMMAVEIVGGLVFGSIALVADGLHMSTHAGALLLAALAYTYAREHASDPRFSFGTGKLGDLAGFTSAIILAMIALLIGYESVTRLFNPVPIHFTEAISIAFLGLAVNIASAWLLSGDDHHNHGHGHDHGHKGHDDVFHITTDSGIIGLEIFEQGVPPRFRLFAETGPILRAPNISLETSRSDGGKQTFTLVERNNYLESVEEIPEPHAFTVALTVNGRRYTQLFEEHEHADESAQRDNNMRAAIIHVIADAAVSVLVILGLGLAWLFGWLWMDGMVGIVGALVIASWARGLIRDTGAILLDMTPDRRMADNLRTAIESEGDQLTDLHIWRLGPGHLGAIVSVATASNHDADYFRSKLSRFRSLSHLTIEVKPAA